MRVYVRVAWSEKDMLAVFWWLVYAQGLLVPLLVVVTED
jgi:hypothetical protein